VVSEICECSASHVKATWKKYRDGGVTAINAVKMGRPKNSGCKLSPEQEKKIIKMITDKNPQQLRLPGCLWDRKLVAGLIMQEFRIKMPLSTMGHYLDKWGFTAQRPTKKHYKQNEKEVQSWLEEEYPAISAKAKEENAEINWLDETGISNESGCIKGYSPKGQTPVLAVGNHKIRINMISAITNQGKLRFHFYREKMTQQLYIDFLEKLVKSADRMVYAIADNLKVHHGKLVKAWAQKNSDKIRLFYLPSYSPHLNPDECLNNNLKTEMSKKGYSINADEVQEKAMSVMRSIGKTKNRVKNFFDKDEVKYAKD
jgi:transposase